MLTMSSQINILMKAIETMPTTTTHTKLLVMIAVKSVGNVTRQFSTFKVGKWPKCWSNKFSNHKADIITTGTKFKYSMTPLLNFKYFNKIKGIILVSHITRPQPKIVKTTKLTESMFQSHPDSASN